MSKSRHTRLPEVAFKEYVRDDIVLPEEPNRKLNPKRETVSFEEPHSGSSNKFTRSPENRSRSLEERDVGMDSRPKNRAFQPQVTLVPEGACSEGSPPVAMGARRKENVSESVSTYVTPTTSRTNSEEIQTLRWPKRLTQGALRNNRIPKVVYLAHFSVVKLNETLLLSHCRWSHLIAVIYSAVTATPYVLPSLNLTALVDTRQPVHQRLTWLQYEQTKTWSVRLFINNPFSAIKAAIAMALGFYRNKYVQVRSVMRLHITCNTHLRPIKTLLSFFRIQMQVRSVFHAPVLQVQDTNPNIRQPLLLHLSPIAG